MNIVFIITLFILFFSTLQGLRKGILGIIYGLVSWVFVLIFVAFSHTHIEDYLKNNTDTYAKIYTYAEKYIDAKASEINDEDADAWSDTLVKELPPFIAEKLPEEALQMQDEQLQETEQRIDEVKNSLKREMMLAVADFVLQGISVMLSFAAAILIVFVVGGLVKGLGMLPLVKEINGLMGIIAGAAEGFLLVWILMYIATCICGTPLGQTVISDIKENAFLLFLYEHNLFLAFLSAIG